MKDFICLTQVAYAMKNDVSVHSDDFINSLMKIPEPAKQEVLACDDPHNMEEKISACEVTAVSHSLRNLLTHPWIRDRVEAGKPDLVGCYYDLHTSELVEVDVINADMLKCAGAQLPAWSFLS